MAELTVFPSLDGRVYCYDSGGRTWSQILASSGTHSHDTGSTIPLGMVSYTEQNKWTILERGIILFDTPVPSGALVLGGILYLYGRVGKENDLDLLPAYSIYSSAPASNTALVPGDYDSLGDVAFCDVLIAYADWKEHNTNQSLAQNTFILNPDGLLAITLGGITKLGVREVVYDVEGVAPSWTSNLQTSIQIGSAESANSLWRPKLVITYALPGLFPPVVRTEACTEVEAVTLTAHGTIVDLGDAAVTQHGHCWATTAYPDTDDDKTENGVAPHTGHFTSAVTGLTPDTNYFLRAYAINSYGTAYGENVESQPGFFTGWRDIYIYKKVVKYYDRYGDRRILEGRLEGAGDV